MPVPHRRDVRCKRLNPMKKPILVGMLGVAVVAFACAPVSAATLDDVKERGFVKCGVSEGLPGFSDKDEAGNWSGLDVDLCRAVAAAIFGDPSAVEFTALSATARFTELQSGKIDLLPRNTTWAMSYDTQYGLNFTGTNYYDGQSFMVRTELKMNSALELSGASICTTKGTTTELNVIDYFSVHNMNYRLVSFERADEVLAAYEEKRCDAYTADQSALYARRLKLANPKDHKVLPEIISKEPLGPVVREGDDQWFDIVKWVHFAMVNAEELGVTQQDVETMKNSDNHAVKRLLGTEGEFGVSLGLGNDWAANIISSVGNYGEVFDRNLGPGTEIGIARGINALWTKGGLMYAPPIR